MTPMTLPTTMAESTPPARGRRLADGRLRLAQAFGRLPPTALLLLSLVSVQLGSALATVLFSGLGPAGTTLASTGFAAAILTLLSPPTIDRRIRQGALLILVFGLSDTCMALPFFLALQRIPLGIASAIAFLGPLSLAVVASRRLIHFLCIAVAVIGVGLLTPVTGGDLDPLGLGLAALSAAAWAGFVPISKTAGRAFDGVDGLTFGLWGAPLMQVPLALAERTVLHAGAAELVGALAVALLTTVLPMALEYRALQRMSARTYGILVTLEPAIGALVGVICLDQVVGPRISIAIACITIAALGVTWFEALDDR